MLSNLSEAAYGGGLRVSEVVHLRWSDLDRDRGLIRIEQGKGKKDRYTVLPRCVGEPLDRYRTVYPPNSKEPANFPTAP